MTTARATIALALAAAVLAGCGSGGAGATTTAATQAATATTLTAAVPAQATKGAFIHHADQVCAHTNHRLKPIIARIIRLDLSTQPIAFRLSGYRDAFHALGGEYEDLVGQLQQLEVPNRDHRLVTRTLRLLDSIPLHLDRLQAAITDLDVVSLIRSEIKLNHTFIQLGGTADSYGFRVCGVVPGRHRRGSGPLPTAKNV